MFFVYILLIRCSHKIMALSVFALRSYYIFVKYTRKIHFFNINEYKKRYWQYATMSPQKC